MAKDKQLPRSPRQKQLEKSLRKALSPVAVGRMLIVCEGEKTEPNYFKWYQTELYKLKKTSGIRIQIADKVYVDVAKLGDDIKLAGVGRNTKSLVEYALNLAREDIMDYTEVWCVFDRDSFPAKDFNEAIFLARENNIHVAYSNEAFELWYLLHYDYHNTALSRTQYKKKLSTRLGKSYRKNSVTMYEDILASGGDQQRAINHAKKLLKTYNSELTDYAAHNPSTTVHLLVAALNQFLEDFRKKVDSFQ